jgi:hypothetical protein
MLEYRKRKAPLGTSRHKHFNNQTSNIIERQDGEKEKSADLRPPHTTMGHIVGHQVGFPSQCMVSVARTCVYADVPDELRGFEEGLAALFTAMRGCRLARTGHVCHQVLP